jgi:4-hydroxy-2-oxoheptanedioate aldolase
MFIRERLARDGEVLHGVLAAIPSAVSVQAMAAAGADFAIIDREHSPVGRDSMQAMIAATAGTQCAPLVRVPRIDGTEVNVALDAGAEGIVFPMVRTVEDVERSVASVRYPPDGTRGWGPFVAHSRHRTTPGEYARAIGPQMTCWIQVETVEAVEAIEEIVRVEGVDVIIVAPFDLSTALGVAGRFDAPAFVEAVGAIERAALGAGIALSGVAFDGEQAKDRIARGYRVLLRGIDVFMLGGAVAAFRD